MAETLEISRLNESLSEARSLQDACHKMLFSTSSWKQLLMYSKSKMVLSMKIDKLNDQILKERTHSTLKISEIRWPLIWTEESKKKENITGYGFLLFKTETDLFDTELIEFSNFSFSIKSPGLQLLNVSLNNSIEIIAYFNLFDSFCLKKLTKTKILETDGFQYQEVGRTSITVQDLTKLTDSVLNYEFNIDKDVMLKPYKKEKSYSTNLSSNSVNSIGKFDSVASMFGVKLHNWNKASAYVSCAPIYLMSPFNQFVAKVIWNSGESLSCITFEKSQLNFYDCIETYMSMPLISYTIPNITPTIIGEQKNKIGIKDFTCNSSTTIVFENDKNASDFLQYFKLYLNGVQTWGANIDTHMNAKTACNIISELVANPTLITPLLTKKPLVQTAF
ncbi:hypothetical protein HZS_2227 [Henneguya salminicola]|nr:hypothetical protein HZS_2227 [Henneguya salminicola]